MQKNINHSKNLSDDVMTLPFLGEKSSELFHKNLLKTVEDLIWHFPERYEILNNSSGQKGILEGTYCLSHYKKNRNGKNILQCLFENKDSVFYGCWIHFNSKYPLSTLFKGKKYYLYGTISSFNGAKSIYHPEFIDKDKIDTIRSVYSLPGSFKRKTYSNILDVIFRDYIEYVDETLPSNILKKYNFPEIKSAVKTIHNPKDQNEAMELEAKKHPAYIRFIYEELFYLQLGLLIKKESYKKVKGIQFKINNDLLEDIKKNISFKLTAAQKIVLVDIFNDMKKNVQMNRLLQGDVGSGKTIIAFISGLIAVKNNYQVALIAPTEVLAEQHYENLQAFVNTSECEIDLLTGSTSQKDKALIKLRTSEGKNHFIVGTHAILQENVVFRKLGMAIIDEQHRFGVMQRKALFDKGYSPDILLITATPIPRTLSLTFYGDLDISIIDEMPPGRKKIITFIYSEKKINEVFEIVQKEIDKDNKIYFIYPLIDESDKVELKSAKKNYELICKHFNKDIVGLLHGKLPSKEKKHLIDRLKNGDLKILVSTTVIEVGIDVASASVIVIENAERFGLSQLHQLRGRIGRSGKQSYCILIYSKNISDDGRKRLEAMKKFSDGFKISEIDLNLRGPGDFFGTRQSGLPEFRFTNIVKDRKILNQVRDDISQLLNEDEKFSSPCNKVINKTLKNKWKGGLELSNVG